MEDYVVKSIAFNKEARIYAINSTKCVNDAVNTHELWPTASAALGRTLSITAMMGLMHKNNEDLTIRIDGKGPLGVILVNSNNNGDLKGYVTNAKIYFKYENGPKKGKLNVSLAVGTNGNLTVTKDLKMKDFFNSSVAIQTGEIAEDFTYYFSLSEQIPTAVSAGVLVDTDSSIKASGGFIIQLLPDASEETISKIESILKSTLPVSEMIKDGKTPEDIIKHLTSGDYTILEKKHIQYKCDCNRLRFFKGIITLGKEEIKDIITKDGFIQTICHFCKKDYKYTKEDFPNIFE